MRHSGGFPPEEVLYGSRLRGQKIEDNAEKKDDPIWGPLYKIALDFDNTTNRDEERRSSQAIVAPNKRSKLVSGTPRQKAGAPKIESIKTWGASEHEAWVEMARNQQKAFAESMQEFVGSDLPGFLGDEAVELVAESTKWFESVRQRTLVELQGTSESVLNKMTRFKKQKSVFCQNVKSFRAMEKKRLKARQEVRRITKQQNANITNRTRKTRTGEKTYLKQCDSC